MHLIQLIKNMLTKKISSNACLRIILEAYRHDPEGLLSDLEIIVESDEGLVEFAQSAVESIQLNEEDEYEIEADTQEHNKKVAALVAA